MLMNRFGEHLTLTSDADLARDAGCNPQTVLGRDSTETVTPSCRLTETPIAS